MKNSAVSARAFLDGFSLSGLFAWTNLPGGAETLVEQTNDLSESQFADLFLPFSQMAPDLHRADAYSAIIVEAAKAEEAELGNLEATDNVEDELASVLARLGKKVGVETVRRAALRMEAATEIQVPVEPPR